VTAACPAPVSDDTLLGWWSGELAPAERRRLEEHLLSCGACSSRAAAVQELAGGVRELVREGALPVVVLPEVVERLQREGRRIRQYRLPPGGGVRCTVAPEDDVVLARLVADLRGAPRVDLVSRVDDGPEQRMRDVPFDAAAGEVLLLPPADVLRARPAHVQTMLLLAVEGVGERLLGEYRFDHRPWPGW
jgi:anti-sigma factor RsiW